KRQNTEASNHIDSVRHQFAKCVVGLPIFSLIVSDGYGSKARSSPCEQHVNRDEGTVVTRESATHVCAQHAKSAYLPGDLDSHAALKRQFRDLRSQIAPETVLFLSRRAIYYIVTFVQFRQQFGN